MHVVYVDQDSLLARMFFEVCHTYFPDLPVHQNWMPYGDSDFSSFNRSGYPALHPFEDVYASSPYIHTQEDVLGLSVNNLEQSRRFAQVNLSAVAHLAGMNNASVEDQQMPLVTIYPNPAKETVSIVAEGLQSVVIYNLLGQSVETKVTNKERHCVFNTSTYSSGIYVVKITTDKGITTEKLMIR